MDIKDKLKEIDRRLNPIQRIVVAVVIPIVVILIGWGVMTNIVIDGGGVFRIMMNPINLSDSWWTWLIVISVIGVFEYFWFRNRD